MTLRFKIKTASLAALALYVTTGMGFLGQAAQQENQKVSTAALLGFTQTIQDLAARYFAAHPLFPPPPVSPPTPLPSQH